MGVGRTSRLFHWPLCEKAINTGKIQTTRKIHFQSLSWRSRIYHWRLCENAINIGKIHATCISHFQSLSWTTGRNHSFMESWLMSCAFNSIGHEDAWNIVNNIHTILIHNVNEPLLSNITVFYPHLYSNRVIIMKQIT